MTIIEKYYELLHQINISDFRIGLLSKSPADEADFNKEKQVRDNLQQELDTTVIELNKTLADADSIRTAFIHVANGVLKSFARIKSWGDYYPDLNQGMVISGYLFGKILNDFNTALKYEGGLPVTEIYMSQAQWDYTTLASLIESIRAELIKSSFATKMEAINYYEYTKTAVLEIVNELRLQGVV